MFFSPESGHARVSPIHKYGDKKLLWDMIYSYIYADLLSTNYNYVLLICMLNIYPAKKVLHKWVFG